MLHRYGGVGRRRHHSRRGAGIWRRCRTKLEFFKRLVPQKEPRVDVDRVIRAILLMNVFRGSIRRGDDGVANGAKGVE